METTTAVGSYAGVSPHPWGLADVIGNVWEWCGDWYAEYPDGETTDPTGSENGSYRVYRGGSWNEHAWVGRAAHRSRGTPDDAWYFHLGFRFTVAPSDQ